MANNDSLTELKAALIKEFSIVEPGSAEHKELAVLLADAIAAGQKAFESRFPPATGRLFGLPGAMASKSDPLGQFRDFESLIFMPDGITIKWRGASEYFMFSEVAQEFTVSVRRRVA